MSRALAATITADHADNPGVLASLYEAGKPRITRLVTITSAVGFAMAGVSRSWEPAHLVLAAAACLVGTALSSHGANALNEWMERDRDARMPRTAARPIPSHRISPALALAAGTATCALGVLTLLLFTGPLPAAVALATILLYLFVYTPLKPVTPLATIVGAVPGALPPLIGWTAASAHAQPLAEPAGWSLVLLMTVWQIPHFLAIAWLYRDDYAKGGYAVLPVVDPAGRQTVGVMLVWTACLVPATLAPALAMPHLLSTAYLMLAMLSGAAFAGLAAQLAVVRSRDLARRTFIASVIHLPVLLVAMVVSAAAHALL